ncbi:surface carbohydrate biosynthesis protein [Nitrosomonas halophila]|uniref:Surface carbohydrate biosynthesis protein n=1 Tax=Nitrosomonas halophila TaxID=44576 RepID=A0A1H3JD77_9PROT|nr:surface carbohydrate biosynthesis protein [Nitrosomonas halophila]SDY37358.1 surface carbohydrate biosynthesis protein [Nitrosomonas halophila]
MRWLILPCETRSRELDAKLLLAVLAAARGITSIVGSKKPIDLNLHRFDPAVYVGKSLTGRSRLSLTMPKLLGHKLAVWDEEGLVWASPEIYWRTKIHGPNLNLPSLLIAWGEANAAAWRDHPDYSDTPIALAGNPRTDLLRPVFRSCFDDELNAIRQRHGRFVLINTNFSRVNHYQPRQNRHLKWLREGGSGHSRAGFARHKWELYNAFLATLPDLIRALPSTCFVLRPHPSENRAVWDELAAGLPNLAIDREGNVVPWLMAADAVIHNGCTTAIEACQLECPAIAYRPVVSDQYDHPLPNGISLEARNVAELADRVAACIQDRTGSFRDQIEDPARRALLNRALATFDAPELASERILDALQPLLACDVEGSELTAARLVLYGRRLVAGISRHIPGTANYQPYIAHMFPPTDDTEVQYRVNRLARCLGLAAVPKVSPLLADVFQIQPGFVS